MQIENNVADRSAPIVVYGDNGIRSALAAKTLKLMGYSDVSSMSDGYEGWSGDGLPTVKERSFNPEQMQRYARHFMVPEVGEKGQASLLDARVLLGWGGGASDVRPGSISPQPVSEPSESLMPTTSIFPISSGRSSTGHRTWVVQRRSPRSKPCPEPNPGCNIRPYQTRLSSENALDIIRGYDIIINGCDNFPTRYLLNDACVFEKKTIVDGSIYRFEGQATVYAPGEGPCYRCLYPEPPPPGMVPSCADAGVLGVLPGMIGLVQATEAIKLIIGKGQPLIGRLMIYDALEMTFRTLKVRRNPECPVCGDNPTVTQLIDYEQFCGLPPRRTDAAD